MATNSKVLEIVIKAKDEATKTLSGIQKTLEKNQKLFKGMAVSGGIAFAGLSASITKLVKDGAGSASISESFFRMTKTIGLDADKLISKLNEVSAGTVSQTDLMLSSNKAMALGVGNNLDDITTLMEIARVKGRALGLDTTQAFNDIVTGIGRGSPLILDNLGITIKLGEAQENYAQQLGKTVGELTDAEKKQALLNSVLQSGKAELATVGEVALTSKERFAQLSAQFANLSSTLGESLLPVVEKAMNLIVPVLTQVSTWITDNPKLATTVLLVVTALAGLVFVLGTLGIILPSIIAFFGLLSPTVLIVGGIIAGLILIVKNVIDIFHIFQNDLGLVWDGIKIMFKESIDYVVGLFSPLLEIIDRIKNAMANLVGGAKDTAKKAGSAIKNFGKKLIGRAVGGGVQLGQSYVVGERGPELFTPSGNGSITPNHKLAGAGGGNITVNINGGTYLSESVAEDIGDMIIQKFKRVSRF